MRLQAKTTRKHKARTFRLKGPRRGFQKPWPVRSHVLSELQQLRSILTILPETQKRRIIEDGLGILKKGYAMALSLRDLLLRVPLKGTRSSPGGEAGRAGEAAEGLMAVSRRWRSACRSATAGLGGILSQALSLLRFMAVD